MHHLLEWRERSWEALATWLEATPVQRRLRAMAEAAPQSLDAQAWARTLVDSLCQAGQLQADAQAVRLRPPG